MRICFGKIFRTCLGVGWESVGIETISGAEMHGSLSVSYCLAEKGRYQMTEVSLDGRGRNP
jgi:methenyltetrahydromethanopterin cyclohydrolase